MQVDKRKRKYRDDETHRLLICLIGWRHLMGGRAATAHTTTASVAADEEKPLNLLFTRSVPTTTLPFIFAFAKSAPEPG